MRRYFMNICFSNLKDNVAVVAVDAIVELMLQTTATTATTATIASTGTIASFVFARTIS